MSEQMKKRDLNEWNQKNETPKQKGTGEYFWRHKKSRDRKNFTLTRHLYWGSVSRHSLGFFSNFKPVTMRKKKFSWFSEKFIFITIILSWYLGISLNFGLLSACFARHCCARRFRRFRHLRAIYDFFVFRR